MIKKYKRSNVIVELGKKKMYIYFFLIYDILILGIYLEIQSHIQIQYNLLFSLEFLQYEDLLNLNFSLNRYFKGGPSCPPLTVLYQL